MDNTLCYESEQEHVVTERVGAVLIVRVLSGTLDARAAHARQQAILEAAREAGARTVVLDLRAVRLIDAAGWAMLIAVSRRLRHRGCRLRLLLARGSQPFRAFVTRWLHVVLDRVDSLEELTEWAVAGDGARQIQGACE